MNKRTRLSSNMGDEFRQEQNEMLFFLGLTYDVTLVPLSTGLRPRPRILGGIISEVLPP